MTLSKQEKARREELRAIGMKLNNPNNPFNPPEEDDTPPTMPMGQWIEAELAKPAQPFLLHDMIMPAGLTVIAGRPKLGKSFLALGSLIAMSSGKAAGMLQPNGVSASLYLDLEGVARATAVRAEGMRLAAGLERSALDNIHMFTARKIEVLKPGYAAHIVDLIEQTGAQTVVFDTFAASFTGDENAKRDVQHYLDVLADIRRTTGCAAVLIHHVSKASYGNAAVLMNPDNGLRGSSALQGAYDIILSLQDGYVEGRHQKFMIGRGKYTEDFWCEFKVTFGEASIPVSGEMIRPFSLSFGERHDEYVLVEAGPSSSQGGWRKP